MGNIENRTRLMNIEKWQAKKFEEIKHLDENGKHLFLQRSFIQCYSAFLPY